VTSEIMQSAEDDNHVMVTAARCSELPCKQIYTGVTEWGTHSLGFSCQYFFLLYLLVYLFIL